MAEHAHPATVVILGVVEHSAQLIAESYQPAVFRAFFQRVQPDVICVERSPQEFLRGDYCEYSYEVQHIAVPFARQAGIPVYPIDWLPAADDQLLAWGVPDLETPPFIRTPDSYKQFLCFHDDAILRLDLFAAEAEAAREPIRQWYDQPRQSGERDFPRRLGLYRTYMQAMRIKAVARTHPGATILIVIGQMHKEDVEGILGAAPELAIIQPSSFGYPSPEAVDAATTRADLCAIASFNLLGVQSKEGPVDWGWLQRVVARLEEQPTAETRHFRTRLDVLTGGVGPEDAAQHYERIRMMARDDERFTFTGVKDAARIDSYYDPFGNLSVEQRARLEIARESYKGGRVEAAEGMRTHLLTSAGWSVLQRHQLEAYWDAYVVRMA